MPNEYTIQIHWGYWWWYGLHPIHAVDYCWDGEVLVEAGHLAKSEFIEFGGIFGIETERYIAMERPSWHWEPSHPFNRAAGVRVTVKGGPETTIRFCTRAIDFCFTIEELTSQKLIQKKVGSRYTSAIVSVQFDGYDPNADHEEDIKALTDHDGRWRRLVLAADLPNPTERLYRTDWIMVDPGGQSSMEIENPGWGTAPGDAKRSLGVTLRCVAMPGWEGGRPEEGFVDREGRVSPTVIPYRIFVNDAECVAAEQYFGAMPPLIPLMEELSVKIPAEQIGSSPVQLRFENDSKTHYVLIARLLVEEIHDRSLEIKSCPRWILIGNEFDVVVQCNEPQHGLEISLPTGVTPEKALPESLDTGEHRLRMKATEPVADATIRLTSATASAEAVVDQVFAAEQDAYPMRIGFEDKLFNPNHPGLRAGVLREMVDTQLGDYMIYRLAYEQDEIVGLAELCREYGIHYQMAHSIPAEWWSAVRQAGGEYFTSLQWTEHDGPLWGYLVSPQYVHLSKPENERTMKTAHDDYVTYMKRLVEVGKEKDPDMSVWVMISAVGHDMAYRGGMEACVSQFNKTHNALMIADAKGAARTYKRPFWGSYMAEGAHINPEGDHHLRTWWLALHLAHISGASYANDEESAYRTWHERIYSYGDRFPRTRRAIMRRFNHYAKTHPRRGKLEVNQAILTGQYACDSIDGIADSLEEGKPPMVWRNFGGDNPMWRPATPEYGMRYLDVFFPGVWLQALEQHMERVRYFYSGTPYGELELIPADASPDVLSQFPLLLLLGWNTMDEKIHANLKQYVENGGTLFMSAPQLTTHEARDFLSNDLEPLNLLRDGDVRDLFGVRITGRAEIIRSIEAVEGIEQSPITGVRIPFHRAQVHAVVRPDHDPVYLEDIELCGAEVIAREGETGKPILIRHRQGRGSAYLLLTSDFPGNSHLVPFMTELVRGFARQVPTPVRLHDPCGEVYYTVRVEEETQARRIHLLNTHWAEAGNERPCTLILGDEEIPLAVREGQLSEVIWLEDLVVLSHDEVLFIDEPMSTPNGYALTLHGFGTVEFRFRLLAGTSAAKVQFDAGTVQTTPDGSWISVTTTFQQRSRGTLVIECS